MKYLKANHVRREEELERQEKILSGGVFFLILVAVCIFCFVVLKLLAVREGIM